MDAFFRSGRRVLVTATQGERFPVSRRIRVAIALSGATLAAVLAAAVAPTAGTARSLSLEDRVRAQEAIERVYHRHLQGTRKSFEEALPHDVLVARVEDDLRKSVALERFWNTPVTAKMLEREVERMVRDTRMPERLAELFAALDNDAVLIQECLARPILVDRLARRFFAADDRLHPEAHEEIERLRRDLAGGAIDPAQEHPRRTIVEIVRREAGAAEKPPRPERAVDGAVRLDVEPEGFARERQSLPGEIGAVSRVESTAEALVVRVSLEATADRLRTARFAVPKRPWDMWWGETRGGIDAGLAPVVAEERWSLPELAAPGSCTGGTEGQWIPGALDNHTRLAGRNSPTAVWTGSEMIVWGGDDLPSIYATGARYDPATDTWSPTSTAGAPVARHYHSAVWAGSQMLIWGGEGVDSPVLDTGGRYDPLTDAWTPISVGAGVPAARRGQAAFWTGSEMIVWGGNNDSELLNTGGRYNPSTDSWVPTSTGANVPSLRYGFAAVWTGSEMIVWGGEDDALALLNTGSRYDPSTDTWSPTSTGANVPPARRFPTAVWTGEEMIIWGGRTGSSTNVNSGGRYDPASDTWAPTSTGANVPTPRETHTAVWTGSRMLIWGGLSWNEAPSLGTGAGYDPSTDQWSPISTVNAPGPRRAHSAVWTGERMVIWGGTTYVGDWEVDATSGGRYDPVTDSWTPTAATMDAPETSGNAGVWTGNEMVVFGGMADFRDLDSVSGSRYDPATDNWSPTATTAAPAPRYAHTVVWTGDEMIVWGGSNDGPGAFGGGGPLRSGGRYDPTTDVWAPTSTTGAPSARRYHTAVWTGTTMIVWGGRGNTYEQTGGRYDPLTDSWVPTAIAGAAGARWRHTAVWTGSTMVVWGGSSGSYHQTGGRYDPATDTWLTCSLSAAPTPRDGHAAVWTGSKMIVWGGQPSSGGFMLNTGGRYDPLLDSWLSTTASGAPPARRSHTAVWTGREMIIWGGTSNSSYLDTGGRYDPTSNSWIATEITGAPPATRDHVAVWTGNAMIVWGGVSVVDVSGIRVIGLSGGIFALVGDDVDGDGICSTSDCDDANPNCWMDCTDQDGDTWCPPADCYDLAAACTDTCVDADGDDLPTCASDCDDANAHCLTDCTDADADGFCVTTDCDDAEASCDTLCTDADSDGVAVCEGDCDDGNPNCLTDCTDADADGWCGTTDCDDARPGCAAVCADADADGSCVDADCDDANASCGAVCTDGDGDGVAACQGDCNDANAHCTTDCTDADADGWCVTTDCDDTRPGCAAVCADADADGHCVGVDCDDTRPFCTTTCQDVDADGYCAPFDCLLTNPHCQADCTDADADGFCVTDDCDELQADCTTDCTDADADGLPACASDCDDANPNCMASCTDQDGDGYCVTHDCDDLEAGCTTNCTDADADGHCAIADCDEANPHCATDCADLDGDGWCGTTDCDDALAICTASCADLDGDGFRACTGDCDDTAAEAHPGGTEVCTDGLDNDCDGFTDNQEAVCSGLASGELRFDTKTALHWVPAPAADAHALYRGSIGESGMRGYTHLCEATLLASADAVDADVPPPGQGFYYLGAGLSISPAGSIASGSLGTRSSGAARPDRSGLSCGTRVYVDADAVAGDRTGLSWADAYTSVAGALSHSRGAGRGIEVWSRQSIEGLASAGGSLHPGLRLLGGFDGTESAAWERSPGLNPTVWDGAGALGPLLTSNSADVVIDGVTLKSAGGGVRATVDGDHVVLENVRMEQIAGWGVDLEVVASGRVVVEGVEVESPGQGSVRALVRNGVLEGRIRRNALDGGAGGAIVLEARPTAVGAAAEVRVDVVGNTVVGGVKGIVLGARIDNRSATAVQASFVDSNVVRGTVGDSIAVEATGTFTSVSGPATVRSAPIVSNNTLDGGQAAGIGCRAVRSDTTGNPAVHAVLAVPELRTNLVTHHAGRAIEESIDNEATGLVSDPVVVVANGFHADGALYVDEGAQELNVIGQVNALAGAGGNFVGDPLYVDRGAADYHLRFGTVLGASSPMRYLANAGDPGLGLSWTLPVFDDAVWEASGFGVGYDSGPDSPPPSSAAALLATEVPEGTLSVFTRTEFEVGDASAVTRLVVGGDYDDGYVAWINRVEVFRSASMPPGSVSWDTAAAPHESSNGSVPTFDDVDISVGGIPLLVDGTNVLAVGVWNASAASVDLVLVPHLVVDEESPAVDVGLDEAPRVGREDRDGAARSQDGDGDGVARPDAGAHER